MFKTVISLLLLTLFFIIWNDTRLQEMAIPCKKPVAYTIGSFDRRFGLLYTDFLGALSEAEAVWEKPFGKELFIYAPETGELAINLIYDYRQEVTVTLSDIGSTVKEDKVVYQALEAKYAGLKTEYAEAKSAYETQVEMFEEKKSTYESQVDAWNASPRTSREQFNQLEAARLALQADVVIVKTTERQLNTKVWEFNILVDRLNRLAHTLNLNVKTYNTIGASRGESFTGGLYSQAEGETSIDIYEFSNREKLVRVLAHELGHALGLEHVDDSEAIMYYLNEGEAEVLTKADLAALKALCYTKDIKNK